MESQRPAKRGREEAAAGSMDNDDRISRLPELILDHVLSFLPQNEAVRTCVLSKSWRHLGPTRTKLEFRESCFPGTKKQELLSVVENTLQRYDDQKLWIQEFILEMPEYSESTRLLNKWIRRVIMKNMGVKAFNLTTARHFSLPSIVFRAQLLTELHLDGCKLDQINDNNCIIVKLQVLKRLSLKLVYIEEEAFEKIMLGCPLIEHLVLYLCQGLRTIKVNKAPNLKHFDCYIYCVADSIEIDDSPPLETLRIKNYRQNWYKLHNNYIIFRRLKSLYLWDVHLPSELFVSLSSSNNCFPCLEELQLHYCSGFSELKLMSSRSIKRLVINKPDSPIKAVIDAANMLYFEFRSRDYLPSLSFATTDSSSKWKSLVHVQWCSSDSNADDEISTWSLKLYEFLKALSQSQISLLISNFPLKNQDTFGGGGGGCEPVVIEHLCLMQNYRLSLLQVLLNGLFRICRPRYIGLSIGSDAFEKREESQLAESILKILVKEEKGETRQCDFWRQDLKKATIQVSDMTTNEWHCVQDCALSNNQSIRFRLKWRDLS